MVPRIDQLPTFAALVGAAVVASVLASCGGGDERLVVFAASSLTDVFAELETGFEADHPGIDVVVSHDGSSALAAQIEQGAPVDVFAAADTVTMKRVADEVDGPISVFARNRLEIAVEAGNPHAISGLADLGRDGLIVVLAAPEVPVGGYAATVLDRAGVMVRPASLEQNVRAVAAKVALGEADAGIVYRTDVVAATGRIEGVRIADADNVIADYPIAVVDGGDVATEFVAHVLGTSGRAVLVDHGFVAP